mmetsp:Transcript_11184/g.22294  ORF Transcript_11184/g.22294 Transcript_11184/m.22294 type:complete len:220 (-) Transcript_11184:612-1271(-)
MAKVSWHSRLRAPRLMPPVQKRVKIASTGSTWSRSMGLRPVSSFGCSSKRSRRAVNGRFPSCVDQSLNAAVSLLRTALCRVFASWGLLEWCSFEAFGFTKPSSGKRSTGSGENARSWKLSSSRPRSATSSPPTRDGVPVKATSKRSPPTPKASKIWAPWYELSKEMPILLKIFSKPFSSPKRKFFRAVASSSDAGNFPLLREACVCLEACHARTESRAK